MGPELEDLLLPAGWRSGDFSFGTHGRPLTLTSGGADAEENGVEYVSEQNLRWEGISHGIFQRSRRRA